MSQEANRRTFRENRLYGYLAPLDETKQSEYKTVRFQDGTIRPGITVQGQTVTLDFDPSNSLYPDDVLALLKDMYLSYKNPDADMDPHTAQAISKIEEAIYECDKRAMKRHGYSNSPQEQAVQVPYTVV